MSTAAKDSKFRPLLRTLKKIHHLLASDRPSQVMPATQTIEEFNAQQLPTHCKMARRKLYDRGHNVKEPKHSQDARISFYTYGTFGRHCDHRDTRSDPFSGFCKGQRKRTTRQLYEQFEAVKGSSGDWRIH